MSLRKSLKNRELFFCLLVCYSLATGDSYAGEAEDGALAGAVNELVQELRDSNFLHGSDNYSSVNTELASLIDRDDVQQFFLSIERISSLTESVKSLSVDTKKVVEQVAVQEVEIERNRDDVKDIRYFLAWLVTTIVTGIPAAHVYIHRKDGKKDKGSEGD